jgi:hypothetical protein
MPACSSQYVDAVSAPHLQPPLAERLHAVSVVSASRTLACTSRIPDIEEQPVKTSGGKAQAFALVFKSGVASVCACALRLTMKTMLEKTSSYRTKVQ